MGLHAKKKFLTLTLIPEKMLDIDKSPNITTGNHFQTFQTKERMASFGSALGRFPGRQLISEKAQDPSKW